MTTPGFTNISQGQRKDTAEVAIEGLEGLRPVLVCKPANERNQQYWNELSRRIRRGRAARAGRDVTVKQVNQVRDINVDLIPRLCVVGFVAGTVIDDKGKEVEFSEDNCRALLKAVRDNATESFDDFVADLGEPATFTEYNDPEDVEAQAGNSQAA